MSSPFTDSLHSANNWLTIKGSVRIARAENDLLFDEHNRKLIDLFSGNGTVWLGHANPRITMRLAEQLERIWNTGGLETGIHLEAIASVERFFPATHRVAAFYSTGMEAAEFAIRLSRSATGRTAILGFDRSMHGKSMATARLGWDNTGGGVIPQILRLPFVSTREEPEILALLHAALRERQVAAVFAEPVQGSGGGYSASDAFWREACHLCRQFGTLLVFDEILTGFHRTGVPFCFSTLGFTPDIVLIGKAMGNGFPVSAVVARRDINVTPGMLPGSTYAENPLAAAAVVSTLDELSLADPAGKVAAMEAAVTAALAPRAGDAWQLRGRGAMWILDLPPNRMAQDVAVELYHHGIFTSHAGNALRILPALTIAPLNLSAACAVIARTLRDRRAS